MNRKDYLAKIKKEWSGENNPAKTPEARAKISASRKGKSSWSKGKHLSKEHRRKIAKSHLGIRQTEKAKEKLSKFWKGKRLGNKHPQWKGEDAKYGAKHMWVSAMLGKPTRCEKCGKDGLIGHKIHWANKSRKYKRTLTDWIRLCVPCHKAYDLSMIKNI